MHRWTHSLISTAVVVALGACGGDDAADPPADEPVSGAADTQQDEPAGEPTAENEPADAGGSASGAEVDVAIVTIDGVRYQFDVTPGAIQRCDPNFFGAFWALGVSPAGDGLELILPPPDDPNFDESPRIKVSDDAQDRDWLADPDNENFGVEAGESQVDDFTVDGSTVTGSATFIDLNESYAFAGGGDKPTPVTGTFEVRCAAG